MTLCFVTGTTRTQAKHSIATATGDLNLTTSNATQTAGTVRSSNWQPKTLEYVEFWDHVSAADMSWGDTAEDLTTVLVVGCGFVRRETDRELELISYLCQPDTPHFQFGAGKFTILKSAIVTRRTLTLKPRRPRAHKDPTAT